MLMNAQPRHVSNSLKSFVPADRRPWLDHARLRTTSCDECEWNMAFAAVPEHHVLESQKKDLKELNNRYGNEIISYYTNPKCGNAYSTAQRPRQSQAFMSKHGKNVPRASQLSHQCVFGRPCSNDFGRSPVTCDVVWSPTASPDNPSWLSDGFSSDSTSDSYMRLDYHDGVQLVLDFERARTTSNSGMSPWSFPNGDSSDNNDNLDDYHTISDDMFSSFNSASSLTSDPVTSCFSALAVEQPPFTTWWSTMSSCAEECKVPELHDDHCSVEKLQQQQQLVFGMPVARYMPDQQLIEPDCTISPQALTIKKHATAEPESDGESRHQTPPCREKSRSSSKQQHEQSSQNLTQRRLNSVQHGPGDSLSQTKGLDKTILQEQEQVPLVKFDRSGRRVKHETERGRRRNSVRTCSLSKRSGWQAIEPQGRARSPTPPGTRSPSPAACEPRRSAAVKTIQRCNSKDDFLVKSKLAGMSYRDIRKAGGFSEAESTLRGRFRTLTKEKQDRVRRPTWKDNDLHLLDKAVGKLTRGTSFSNVRVPWKQVADYIYRNGGSYHFGNATCRKKWDEIRHPKRC